MDAEIGKQERLLEIIPGRLIDSTPATDADRRREGRSGPSEPIAKAWPFDDFGLGFRIEHDFRSRHGNGRGA